MINAKSVQKFFSTFAAMEQEMESFEKSFVAALGSEVLPMDAVLRYMSSARGKRFRPRLVFLSAQLFGAINDATRRTALFVEMLHTATLIHDDVVDASDERRGQASVNARWGNKTAVLTGDFLLSKAMLQLVNPVDHQILSEMLCTAMAMSEGELLQNRSQKTEEQNDSDFRPPTPELYLEIITRKTARLIRACCVCGALSVMGAKTEDRGRKTELVGEFGLNLGLVFQMRDDIMDDDDPQITALAKQLLPEYKERALKTLESLAPHALSREAIASLRELLFFYSKI